MIYTERLILQPLTYEQLKKYIQCDNSLEEELQLKPGGRKVSPELEEALINTIMPNVADPTKNYLYSTLWTGISKEENVMVGDLCIVGEPNKDGEIEIGYGTHDGFQGKGYMTEMVGGIIQWARHEPGVKAILASTDRDNVGSCRILEKNGFKIVHDSGNMLYWKHVLGSL